MKQLNVGVGTLGLQGVAFPTTDDGQQPPPKRVTGLEASPAYTVAPLEALKELLKASQYVCQSGASALSVSDLRRTGQAFDVASRQFGDPSKMTYEGKHLRDIRGQLEALINEHRVGLECTPYNEGVLNGMLLVRQLLTGKEETVMKPLSCNKAKSETDNEDKAK